jgi:hypothetical protein
VIAELLSHPDGAARDTESPHGVPDGLSQRFDTWDIRSLQL